MTSSGVLIAVIILMTLTVDALIRILADRLNLNRIQEKLPEAFRGFYSAARYRKAQMYVRVNTQLGWASQVFGLIVVLTFWFGKGFPWLDRWVRSFQLGPVTSGLLFIGLLAVFKMIIDSPFDWFRTFVIEERFGFNQTTWKTYILDFGKQLLLLVILGVPLLAGVLAFFNYAGDHAWWLCWAVVIGYQLFIHYVAPTLIMPLFNKFEPLPEGELKSAIMNYAQSIRFPLDNIFVMDGSKRSTKSNAFFTGFGKNKRIVLFDTLISRHSVPELLSILAHEMGHFKKKHIHVTILLGIVHTGLLFWLLSFFITYQGLYDAFFMTERSIYAGLIFFGMLYSSLDLILSVFLQMLSRRNEFQADRFAVATTKDPEALALALKKLSVHNLSNLTPHPLYVFLYYSHPPVLQRLKAIE